MDTKSKATKPAAADLLETLRGALGQAAAGNDSRMMSILAPVIASAARLEVAANGPNSKLRAWHPFLLDAAALVGQFYRAEAEQIKKAADSVRRSIALAERNPADTLASRPASRRILLALSELGGRDCPQAQVREAARQSETHFSNGVRILTSAGLLTSRQDDRDGRERRLSLTPAGRAAIGCPARARGSTRPAPLHVGTPERRYRATPPTSLRRRSRPAGRYQQTLEVKAVLETQP